MVAQPHGDLPGGATQVGGSLSGEQWLPQLRQG